MARPLRIQVENGIYHVYHRGDRKERIFHDDRDHLRFLRTLRQARDRCQWSVLSYCLMPNHYHLVLRTPLANLSAGMHYLNSTYAHACNRRHGEPGHVFQGRYGSRLIQRDEYLIATLAYVAKNPVVAGLCQRPEDWRWSAHRAITGAGTSRIVDAAGTLALLGESPTTALAVYEDAVRRAGPEPPTPAEPRVDARPDLRELLGRGPAGLLAAHTSGYTQLEIAAHLGCHQTTVARRLRALRRRAHRGGA